MISALIWLVAWLWALTALKRATRNARTASTRPSRNFGAPVDDLHEEHVQWTTARITLGLTGSDM